MCTHLTTGKLGEIQCDLCEPLLTLPKDFRIGVAIFDENSRVNGGQQAALCTAPE